MGEANENEDAAQDMRRGDGGDARTGGSGRTAPDPLDGLSGPVAAAFDGQRLDKALAGLVPALSLRGRRRLFSFYDVLADGVPRSMAHKVRQGQTLTLRRRPDAGNGPAPPDQAPELVTSQPPYLVFYKPAGLHAQSLGPGGGESLESWAAARHPGCIALTRLDRLTSGLVLAAQNAEAARAFRGIENAGRVFKVYLCLARGELPRTVARNALDTDNRAKTKVLPFPAADPLRTTAVFPLARDPDLDLTLAFAFIKKGARHQIRAHLAGLGHALYGDPLYGPGDEPPGTGLFLAHVLVRFPGVSARRFPGWSMPSPLLAEAQQRAEAGPIEMDADMKALFGE